MDAEENLRKKFMHKAIDQEVQIIQLPCPEFTLYGPKRWGHVSNQFDNTFFAIIVVKFLLRVFNNSKNIWQMKTGSKCWELLG